MQPYGMDGSIYITARMQKTKEIIHKPIGEEALRLIDYRPGREGLVFPDFQDKLTQAPCGVGSLRRASPSYNGLGNSYRS